MKMRALSRRAPWLLAAVLAVELAAFAPALVQPGVIRPPAVKASDGTGATVPWHTFWRDEVRSGRLPLWNPFVFGGMPAASEPQMQTFYPPNALWLVLQPDTALKITLLLHVMMGSLLMFGLARELGASELGASVSSLVFGLHGQMVLCIFAGWTQVVAPLALAPGTLWMLVRGFRPGMAAGGIAIGGLILGLQLLAGSPEWARYTLLAGLLIVVAHPGATWTRRAATGAAILAVGILVGAVQLVPTIEAALRSTRGQRAMAAETSLHGAGLPLVTLPTVVAPRLFGPWDLDVSTDGVVHKSIDARISFAESLIYVGVLPFALAIMAVVRRRRETAAWSLMASAGLVLALNDVFHVQCAIDWLLPLHSVFRSPGRFVVIANLGLAVLAGLGVTYLQATGRPSRRTVTACAAGAGVLAAGAIAIIALREPLVAAATSPGALTASLATRAGESGGDAASLARWALGQSAMALGTAAALAILSLAAVVWFAAAPGPRRALAILAIVAADLTLYAAPFLTSVVDLDTLYARDLAVLAPIAGRPDARVGADAGILHSSPNVAILPRTRVLGGYDTFVLAEFERLHQIAAARNPHALAAMGVTHLLKRGVDGAPVLRPLDGARGRAWWTERALVVPDAGRAARMLDAGRPLDFVALEGAARSTAPLNARPQEPSHTIDVDHDEPGRFAARLSAPVEGWLVVTEVFYPGWAATVNGAPVDVRRAFGSLQAVQVPAGASTVVLRYAPVSLRRSLMLSAVGLLLVVGLLAAERRRPSYL